MVVRSFADSTRMSHSLQSQAEVPAVAWFGHNSPVRNGRSVSTGILASSPRMDVDPTQTKWRLSVRDTLGHIPSASGLALNIVVLFIYGIYIH